MSIELLVADDHEVVRRGISQFLRDTEIQIVAQAGDGEEAVAKTLQHRPHVALIDIRMPRRDGLSALEKIRDAIPDARVIIISSYDNPTYVARSAALGAVDFLLKSLTRDELLASIRRAARGAPPPEASLLQQTRRVLSRRYDRGDDGIPLTDRELQVLRHVAFGLSNREISRSLEISVETVKEHVQNVLRKLEVGDRTQAAVWALRRGGLV